MSCSFQKSTHRSQNHLWPWGFLFRRWPGLNVTPWLFLTLFRSYLAWASILSFRPPPTSPPSLSFSSQVHVAEVGSPFISMFCGSWDPWIRLGVSAAFCFWWLSLDNSQLSSWLPPCMNFKYPVIALFRGLPNWEGCQWIRFLFPETSTKPVETS